MVREVKERKPIVQAAREYPLHPILLGRWRKEHLKYAEQAFAGNGNPYRDEAGLAEWERMIGQLPMQNALFKKPYCGSKGKSGRQSALEDDDVRTDRSTGTSGRFTINRADVPGPFLKPGQLLPLVSGSGIQIWGAIRSSASSWRCRRMAAAASLISSGGVESWPITNGDSG